MIKKIKDWALNWVIKDLLVKGNLDGKKTWIGLIAVLLSGASLALGADMPLGDVVGAVLTSIPNTITSDAPVTSGEVASAVSSGLLIWGVVAKIIKKFFPETNKP